MAVVISVNVGSFLNRYDVLDSETKAMSLSLAESCISTAQIKLIADKNYLPTPPGDKITVGSNTCNIYKIDDSGAYKIAKATSTVSSSRSLVCAKLDPADKYKIKKFEEASSTADFNWACN
jgi:hypothetical protein